MAAPAVDSLAFQCSPQSGVIIDFAVERQNVAPTLRNHRLMAIRRKIDDRKATMPKTNARIDPDAFIVGPPVAKSRHHAPHYQRINPAARQHACNAAHRSPSLSRFTTGMASPARRRVSGCPAIASEATLKIMEPEVSLSCEGIERFLGEEDSRVHALRGVSLQLERGTVHAVVGPSGCGKSTLLYILGLLDHADSGWVTIENEAVSHLVDEALDRKRNELLGFIFQFHFLLEDFTAQENVMIPMRRLGALSEPEMHERSAHLLEAVGLGKQTETAEPASLRRRATAGGRSSRAGQ